MPLGEGVKTFLKDKIWCRAVQREKRNWGSLVTTLAQAGLQSFEICPKASRIRQCPSGLLKRRLHLLLRAQEEHVNNVGGCFASFSAHGRFLYESLEIGFDCKSRPARPGLPSHEPRGPRDLNNQIRTHGIMDLAAEGEAISSLYAFDPLIRRWIKRAQGRKGNRDFARSVRLDDPQYLIIAHGFPGIVHGYHSRGQR